MRRLIPLLITFELLGCGSPLERPDANVYGVEADHKEIRGYNLKRDYDNDGTRKKDAKPIVYRVEQLSQLNGWFCTDPQSLKNIKTSLADTRDYIKKHCSCE